MTTNERENSTNQQTKNKSLTQKYFLWLQPCEIWCLLRKKTQFNSTLYDCIRSALENSDTICGLYASDGDCYELFRCLFWPVIMDYHKVDIRNLIFKHDFGDYNHIQDLTEEINKQILSIRIRINRSIQGYPMIPKLMVDQLLEIEERIRNALEYIDHDLQGEYHSLKDINQIDRTKLREKSILFQVSFIIKEYRFYLSIHRNQQIVI
jgi:arginine kinase